MPIPGTTKPERVKENIGAAALELSPTELSTITQGADGIEAKGDRYPENADKLIDREARDCAIDLTAISIGTASQLYS